MKTLDKNIIRIVLSILVIVFGIILISNFYLTLKVISIIGVVLYISFIFCHLLFCCPIFFMIMWVKDYINSQMFFKKIRDTSEIIYHSIVVIHCIILFTIVYFVIPLILAMLFNGSIDYQTAISSIEHTLQNNK